SAVGYDARSMRTTTRFLLLSSFVLSFALGAGGCAKKKTDGKKEGAAAGKVGRWFQRAGIPEPDPPDQLHARQRAHLRGAGRPVEHARAGAGARRVVA